MDKLNKLYKEYKALMQEIVTKQAELTADYEQYMEKFRNTNAAKYRTLEQLYIKQDELEIALCETALAVL